jgi:hypothetical protein
MQHFISVTTAAAQKQLAMTHFDSTKMSDDEYSFIRLYCLTVKADYSLIQTIKHITAPTNLGVTNIADAASLAVKLHVMEREFCATIEELGQPTKRPSKKDEVTAAQVAAVFTQSFFKLVDSATKKAIVSDAGALLHDGWSSGHPMQWQQVLKSLNAMHVQKKHEKFGSSGIINTLLNLLSILPKENAWQEYDDDDGWEDDDEEDSWPSDDDFFS